MLIILYTSLFSYMLFFSTCIAPLENSTLNRENSSKLLRKIFPRNFIFGGIVSFLIIVLSLYQKSLFSLLMSSLIFIFFIVNLYYLVPKINLEADTTIKSKGYSKKFKILHLFSVVLYLTQMIFSLIFIVFYLIFNN